MERFKWAILIVAFFFAIVLIIEIGYLAKIIALGNVEEKSSAGLTILLVGLIKFAEIYSKGLVDLLKWAFFNKAEPDTKA
jgi:hypothetical protein